MKKFRFLLENSKKIIIDNLLFNPLGVLIRTGIDTGARLGELLGISLDDIDFENNLIHIRNGLKKNKVFSEDGKSLTERLLNSWHSYKIKFFLNLGQPLQN